MPLTDEDVDKLAAAIAGQIQGNNGTEKAVTLALINAKLKRICPIVEEDHETIIRVLGIERRVTRLEGMIMGLGGIEVIGLGLLATAVRLGWI